MFAIISQRFCDSSKELESKSSSMSFNNQDFISRIKRFVHKKKSVEVRKIPKKSDSSDSQEPIKNQSRAIQN